MLHYRVVPQLLPSSSCLPAVMYSQTKINAFRAQQTPKVISVTASGSNDEETPLVKVLDESKRMRHA